jgi:hypothetical protein
MDITKQNPMGTNPKGVPPKVATPTEATPIRATPRKTKKASQLVVIQISLAGVALLVGVLVYLLDRQPEHIYFVPHWLAKAVSGDTYLGELSNYVPSFVHVFAFILLTMAIVIPLPFYRRYLIGVCVLWYAIDSLFEIAQMDAIASVITTHVPKGFAGIPFLENTANYFLTSTFDGLDLVSIGLGAMAAYYTVGTLYARLCDYGTDEDNQ